jgi:sulfide dehydrogenase [flavocytochrome c] flavoprotein subunit
MSQGGTLKLTRRRLSAAFAATAAGLAAPRYLRAAARPRVVVIGGGPGGATVSRYLAKDSANAIDVTLIEDSPSFTTCFFSNLYLGGFRSFESITHSYDRLEAGYGISKITARATAVDRDNRAVILADGSKLPYDRLVISPGIDFIWDSVPGYSEEAALIAPHAWKAGPQTKLLHDRLHALEDGQVIIVVAPPNPYRCPPAPYERVSVMAHVLKSRGFTNNRIVIIDAKYDFSKQALFYEGWESHYPGMIEWLAPDIHGGVLSVDAAAGKVVTDFDTFEGALLNIIPAQKAGAIAHAAGLADDSGFCPIEADSMRAKADPMIYVLGDAAIAGDMPKSGFGANSQAKVAAMTIRAELLQSKRFPARYSNTCWSLIAPDDAVKVGAEYAPVDGKITSVSSFISQPHEDPSLRKANAEEASGWYAGMIADTFGG